MIARFTAKEQGNNPHCLPALPSLPSVTQLNGLNRLFEEGIGPLCKPIFLTFLNQHPGTVPVFFTASDCVAVSGKRLVQQRQSLLGLYLGQIALQSALLPNSGAPRVGIPLQFGQSSCQGWLSLPSAISAT